ncbi:hypothetical protein ACFQZQ_13265 [Lysobacter koreensis]|uniref:Alpha-glutamyl/putrescinyl thymine pyrophosphorylase clade 3 domain-containing protein n=1 Tax=Lysobacter koreensis TaxID=266122 RepID=A0ABW2YP95_9GAMM
MRPADRRLATQLDARLATYEKAHGLLPGIEDQSAREVLVEQIIESIRRIDFVQAMKKRPISEMRRNPSSEMYDPLRAAVLFATEGSIDEACWQVFLSVHFGKSLRSAWQYPKDIYGRLGDGGVWGWAEVSSDVAGFRNWLSANSPQLKGSDGIIRRFSNHRKYVSIDAWSENGTGSAVATYVGWIDAANGHQRLFNSASQQSLGEPREAFRLLYASMSAVRSFGRIAKFDYLTMIGKLGLANIEPDSAYMSGATGPLTGSKLLFGKLSSIARYDAAVVALGTELGVNMQVMEDSICNWQKSPDKFIAFRG